MLTFRDGDGLPYEGGPAGEEPGPAQPQLEGWPAAPYVELSEDKTVLVYDWAPTDLSPWREIAPGLDMLQNFVPLAEADPHAVLAYARRWGALGLDEDGNPTSQPAVAMEQVEHWHRWAREARAMVGFGVALLKGKSPELADRKVLVDADYRVPWPWWADSRNLAYHVNRWIALGNVKPEMRWDRRHEEPTFVLRSPALFGALSLLLATSVADRETRFCDICRTRLVPPNRRKLCDVCGSDRERWNRSQRRKRHG